MTHQTLLHFPRVTNEINRFNKCTIVRSTREKCCASKGIQSKKFTLREPIIKCGILECEGTRSLVLIRAHEMRYCTAQGHGMVIIEDNNVMRSGRTLPFRDLLSGIVPAYSWVIAPYDTSWRNRDRRVSSSNTKTVTFIRCILRTAGRNSPYVAAGRF